jgi:anthranilate synthase component 1
MAKVYPSKKEFSELAKKYSLVPVVTEISSDLETPISVFKKICGEKENSILLESYLSGEHFDRYSFICFDPIVIFRTKGNGVEIEKAGRIRKKRVKNPLNFLKKEMKNYRQAPIENLPAFSGGLVGYLGFEMVKFCDDVKIFTKLESGYHDSIMMLANKIIAFDNMKNKIIIINNAIIDAYRNSDDLYEECVNENKMIVEKIQATIIDHAYIPMEKSEDFEIPSSNFTKEEFMRAVEKTKEYISAGDAIQVVLSQKFSMKISGDPFNLYRILRNINPSRYMFYINFGETKLVGSSPEIMAKLKGKEITIRPIAGTVARTGDEERDKELAEKILKDPKERAEHIMLVDLGRNDCGRVAKPGTVNVTSCMEVEKFSHVQHMVSNVVGKLRNKLDAWDLFKASFPQGTLSGAPKIRAIEIINELEPSDRGPYGGIVGYFGFNGDMDTCIVIRTITIKNGVATVQVGAGIVADSVPEKEHEETLRKAMGSLLALMIFLKGGKK